MNIQKETREELYFQNDMVNFEEGRFTELIPVQVPNRRNSEEVFKFLERLWNVVLGKSKPWTIDQTKRSTKDIAFTRSVEDEENEDDKESKGEEEKA